MKRRLDTIKRGVKPFTGDLALIFGSGVILCSVTSEFLGKRWSSFAFRTFKVAVELPWVG